MEEAPIAVVAGATGAVGGHLVTALLARADGPRVITIGRRPPSIAHPRLEHIPATLATLGAAMAGARCTAAFCCLGTTMKAAGSRAAFRAVDHGALAAAAKARRPGVSRLDPAAIESLANAR